MQCYNIITEYMRYLIAIIFVIVTGIKLVSMNINRKQHIGVTNIYFVSFLVVIIIIIIIIKHQREDNAEKGRNTGRFNS